MLNKKKNRQNFLKTQKKTIFLLLCVVQRHFYCQLIGWQNEQGFLLFLSDFLLQASRIKMSFVHIWRQSLHFLISRSFVFFFRSRCLNRLKVAVSAHRHNFSRATEIKRRRGWSIIVLFIVSFRSLKLLRLIKNAKYDEARRNLCKKMNRKPKRLRRERKKGEGKMRQNVNNEAISVTPLIKQHIHHHLFSWTQLVFEVEKNEVNSEEKRRKNLKSSNF